MATPLPVNADPFGRGDGAPRKEVVAGSVSIDEKGAILAALGQAGFRNQSEGVREVLLAYTESPAIREAVTAFLKSRAA